MWDKENVWVADTLKMILKKKKTKKQIWGYYFSPKLKVFNKINKKWFKAKVTQFHFNLKITIVSKVYIQGDFVNKYKLCLCFYNYDLWR